MSIYDEIRFLEGCSYNEKLRMWSRKKAAAAASTNECKRLEQQDITRLYGTGNLKSKVLRYLRLRNVPWVQEVE